MLDIYSVSDDNSEIFHYYSEFEIIFITLLRYD